MTDISRSAIVSYTAAEMYALVNAVEDYPQFLPWCADSQVHVRNEDEVKATLVLSWSGMQKSFTTHNRLQKDKMIEIRLIEGPFHHLEGFWRFENLDDKVSKVSLDMEFEFAGKLLSMAIGPLFYQMVNKLVDAFSERAVQLYGNR